MVHSKHDVGWGNIYWQIFSTKKKGGEDYGKKESGKDNGEREMCKAEKQVKSF